MTYPPLYDPIPANPRFAPVAAAPLRPQAKALPRSDSPQPVNRQEPPAGYRFRIHVPPPDEIGIVLPE